MHSSSQMFQYSKAYKPFQYAWAVEFAEQSENSHWLQTEANLATDVEDWKLNKLTKEEKDFVTKILQLFTQMDVSVAQYYIDYFLKEFKNNEIRAMLASIAAREFIHVRAYALLNDTLGLPEADYSVFKDYQEMSKKIDFMLEADVSTQHGFGLALAKTVCNEGLGLFGAFIMLLNFQRRGLLRGCNTILEWSLRDENLHISCMVQLFKEFCKEHPKVATDEFKKHIYEMFKLSVKLEEKFLDLVFADYKIEGLTKEDCKDYIKYLADRRLIMLGLKGNYKIKTCPLPWVEQLISAQDHSNFFEKPVTSYSVAGLTGEWGYALEETK